MCAIGRSYAVRSRRLMLQSFIFRLQEHPIAYNVRSVFYMKMKIVIIVGIDVTAGQISCVMWIVEYANYILKNNIHRGAHHFHLEWIFYAAQKMHAYILAAYFMYFMHDIMVYIRESPRSNYSIN